MSDGFTYLEEKVMVILLKERKTASDVIADATEIIALLSSDHKAFYDATIKKGLEDAEKFKQLELQNEQYRKALEKIADYAHVEKCPNPGFQPCECLESVAKKALSVKREHEVTCDMREPATQALGCSCNRTDEKPRICEDCGKADGTVTRACFKPGRGYLCHDCDR